MSEVKYFKAWVLLGVGWVLMVIYLSVADLSLPQLGFNASDKLNHAIAYGFLMGWFGQLVRSWPRRLWLAATLVILGIAMELVQGMLSHRWFDVLDALANTTGIIIGAVALHLGADKLLGWFEKQLLR